MNFLNYWKRNVFGFFYDNLFMVDIAVGRVPLLRFIAEPAGYRIAGREGVFVSIVVLGFGVFFPISTGRR